MIKSVLPAMSAVWLDDSCLTICSCGCGCGNQTSCYSTSLAGGTRDQLRDNAPDPPPSVR